ncbi:MAG: DivIVA domain-containing protein [Clostridia bacterium]|nr:DivIVA domain-containing protein [Clostridia bacterium]
MTATFRRAAFGYSKQEVDEYIAQLRTEIDTLRAQTETMQSQLDEQKEQIEKYRDQERYISGALLDAQNRAVEIEQKAQENYDRAIMRLAEDSKLWEDRIAQNRERLIALDTVIENFLSNIRAEVGAARSKTGDDWKTTLEEADRILLAQASESSKEEEKAEESVAQAVEVPVEVPEEDRGGEPAVDPQVDSDIHSLYWRLKNLQQGNQPPKKTVDPRTEKKEEPVEAAVEQPKAEPEKRDMYMPAKTEQDRLTSVLSELGILGEK